MSEAAQDLWARVRQAFDAALDQPAEARGAFLAASYSAEVCEQVTGLLAHHEAATAFLEPAPATLVAEGLAAGPTPPEAREDLTGRVVAGRYALTERLGMGGTATVYAATDRLTEDEVAVKVGEPAPGAAVDLIRHEVLALRLLRLPGVVALLDSGIDEDRSFLVMERVEGLPFPGVPSATTDTWPAMRETTVALLETLARVHAAGAAHCDLKPSNVFVRSDGRPVVLDLGIAQDPGGDESLRRLLALAGTPRYRAPEQLRGEIGTAASDLYAVGVMVYEALSGGTPDASRDTAALASLRAHAPPPPLARVAPHVPASVATVVDRWIALAVEDRPASCREALRMLQAADPAAGGPRGDDPLARLSAPAGGAYAAGALTALFAGHERVHRIPSDAAAELHRRTAGDPDAVRDELGAWERAGLVRTEGERIHVPRAALDRLRSGLHVRAGGARAGDPAPDAAPEVRRAWHAAAADDLPLDDPRRLYHRILAGPLEKVVEEAALVGDAVFHQGRVGEALAVVGEGLAAARGAAVPPDESALLGLLLRISMHTGTPRAMDQVLYALGRARGEIPARDTLEAIARAAQLLLQGDSRRAIATLPPLDDRLDAEAAIAALSTGMFAVRQLPLEEGEARVAEAVAFVEARGDPGLWRTIQSEHAWRAYARGAYAEAAALHHELAEQARTPAARVGSLLNAASAALEACAFDDAVRWAQQALDEATSTRHVHYAARAERVLRAAAYRRGDPLEPDAAFVEAIAAVGVPGLEALVSLNEAAAAWRLGHHALGRSLAVRAETIWRRRNQPEGAWLCHGLALACGASADDEALRAVMAELEASDDHALVAQAAWLIAQGAPAHRDRCLALARSRASRVDEPMQDRRKEVLAIEEVATWNRWPSV